MSTCKVIELLTALENTANSNKARDVLRWDGQLENDTALATTTAMSERPFFRARTKSRVMALYLVTAAAVSGTATNYFSLLVKKRPASAPGTPVTLTTFAADTSTTDDVAAWTPKSIGPGTSYASTTSSDFELAEGDVLTGEVTKAGSGMTFPIATVLAVIEPRD